MQTTQELPPAEMTAPERLKFVREQIFRKTQADFAADLGCTRVALAEWETGRKTPSLLWTVRIKEKTGIECEDWVPSAASAPAPVSEVSGG